MVDFYAPQAIWGRELRHYRKTAALTQGQLAERIHFSEGLISGVETGQLPASPEFAEACDKALGTGGALRRLLDWRKGQIFPSWFGRWHENRHRQDRDQPVGRLRGQRERRRLPAEERAQV
ncbi:helix-turn-helix domain-containing protein, partial [Nonomuraea sp. NPDC004702]